ncbi:MAG: PhzF family phenazine biosynthesis protein [Burkholderiaceae bacterium]
MTTLKLYQVDAFTSTVFGGNPAAVVVLDSWLTDDLMQKIANENNLAETAFVVPQADEWGLRWFTPTTEVPLCGHATLAAAHVLVTHLNCQNSVIKFNTRESGQLKVSRTDDGQLMMDFPRIELHDVGHEPGHKSGAEHWNQISSALGASPQALLIGHITPSAPVHFARFGEFADVAALNPDFAALKALDAFGFIATAPGQDCDFVSRFFAPSAGIDEDPVTGGAHCLLAPYWSTQLGKPQLQARQISARGGKLLCEVTADRVMLIGQAVDYLAGEIHLPAPTPKR